MVDIRRRDAAHARNHASPALAEAVAQYAATTRATSLRAPSASQPPGTFASEPNVSRFWPPTEPGGYALVVNRTATRWRQLSGVTRAEITLTKSVLHRAGPNLPTATGRTRQTAGSSTP